MEWHVKIIAMLLGISLLSIGAVGCGSSPCDQYLAEIQDCCNQQTDPIAEEACQDLVDNADTTNANEAACEAALDSYECVVL